MVEVRGGRVAARHEESASVARRQKSCLPRFACITRVSRESREPAHSHTVLAAALAPMNGIV
jgi:hypothetical protein